MNKISAVIIAKNEEDRIVDCLESVSFCDEIILVDNGSTDKTRELAEKKGANVIEYLSDDFSDLRNLGLKNSKCEWVLYVDADERVTDQLKSSIKNELLNKDNSYSAFKIKRKNFYLGNNEWPKIEYLERLFRRADLIEWYGKVHESPKINGKVGQLEGYLLHFTHRNLTSMLSKTIEWSKIEAELRFKAGHPRMTLWRFPKVMISAFLDSYIWQGGYKIGVAGLIESIYQMFSIFVTYSRLWEMQQKK